VDRHEATVNNMKTYGLLHNWAFLLGAFMIALAIIWNLKQS